MTNQTNQSAAPSAEPVGSRGAGGGEAEPVAVIGSGWQFLWASADSLASIAKRHGLKIGTKLYTAPPASQERDREQFMAGYAAAEADAAVCQVPPPGWHCTRKAGHEGPCAAVQNDDAAFVQRGMDRLREASQEQDDFAEALRDTVERSKVAPAGAAVEIDPLVTAEFRKFLRGEPSAFAQIAIQEQAQQPSGGEVERLRKPLTDERVSELSAEMVKGGKSVNWLVRAIEAAKESGEHE